MKLTTYHRVFPSAQHPGCSILFSTRTAASLLVPTALLQAAERGTIPEAERATLTEHGFLVESVETERSAMLGFLVDLAALQRAYRPIVVLNLDCNLACTYCFEGTRKGRHYLSERTGEQLLRYLEHQALPGQEELHVTFYGGEPLLSMDRLGSLALRMRALCAAAGIPFAFSLITNGTLLTRERVTQLRPLGLKSASVTLDGPRRTHDAARPLRSGAGSFDTILRNLRQVAELVDLQIGGNFTRENYEEFPGLLDDLAAAGLTPEAVSQVRFDPVFQEQATIAPVDFHGGCVSLNEPWLFEATVCLREQILQRGYRTGRIMPSRCMLDFPNEPVVNWDGAIYPCPGLIGREKFKRGDIASPCAGARSRAPAAHQEYFTETGPGATRRERPPSHGESASTMEDHSDRTSAPCTWHNEVCLCCAYLPLCFGGCRYLTLLRTGSTAGVDCRKPYFDAVLERLVVQDIRYGVRA